MALLGASLGRVDPGVVEILLPYRDDLTQQDGFLHAGVMATVVDSACGYAAYTLMPAGASVLSIEFKINMCSPAVGDTFVAAGTVKRAGRTVTVTTGDLVALKGGSSKLVATMQATMMTVLDRPDLRK